MTTAPRIRWQESPVAILSGYVGTLEPHVFSIWQPPQASGEFVLTCELPGMETVRRYADDPEELKPEAERLLAEFTASLGAIFPALPPMSPRCADCNGRCGTVMCAASLPEPEPEPFEVVLPIGATFGMTWGGEVRDVIVEDPEYGTDGKAYGIWVRSLTEAEAAEIKAEADQYETERLAQAGEPRSATEAAEEPTDDA